MNATTKATETKANEYYLVTMSRGDEPIVVRATSATEIHRARPFIRLIERTTEERLVNGGWSLTEDVKEIDDLPKAPMARRIAGPYFEPLPVDDYAIALRASSRG